MRYCLIRFSISWQITEPYWNIKQNVLKFETFHGDNSILNKFDSKDKFDGFEVSQFLSSSVPFPLVVPQV